MGLFDNKTKKETRIVLNFNTFATNGSAIGITNEPIVDKMQNHKHNIMYFGRDFNESDKDYDDNLKQKYIVPVVEGHLLRNTGWSEYKEIIIAVPNRIEDLPNGLDPMFREAMEIVILRKYTEITVKKLLQKGILARDSILKEVYGLEFAKDYKQMVEKWADATALRQGKTMTTPKPSEDKKQ